MSDTTTEILNDTTSVQSRIDTVLASPELDWANDSGWHPGDPLHRHPYERYFVDGEGLSVCPRPMVQLVDETEGGMRCEPCQVSWRGPDSCWVCGEERRVGSSASRLRELISGQATTRPEAEVADAALDGYRPRVVLGFDGSRDDASAVVMAADPGAFWTLPSVSNADASPVEDFASSAGFQLDDWQRHVLREWVRGMSALAELFAEQWCYRPLPLPIDGHEYRRRSRRRRR